MINPEKEYIYKFIINGNVKIYRFTGLTDKGRVSLYNLENDRIITFSAWYFDKLCKFNLIEKKPTLKRVNQETAKKVREAQENKRRLEDVEFVEKSKVLVKELRALSPSATERVKARIGKNPRTLATLIEKYFILNVPTPDGFSIMSFIEEINRPHWLLRGKEII